RRRPCSGGCWTGRYRCIPSPPKNSRLRPGAPPTVFWTSPGPCWSWTVPSSTGATRCGRCWTNLAAAEGRWHANQSQGLIRKRTMRSVLITGAAGFIGANFTHFWLDKYPQDRVIALDALTYAGNTWNLKDIWHNDNLTFVQGDICDQALIEKLIIGHDIDTLVHFAAESHVDRSITGP